MSIPQSEEFKAAVAAVNALTVDPGNDTKLEIYALFKQSTVGPNTQGDDKRPGVFNLKDRYKWDAWKAKGDLSSEEAQQKYIELANSLTQQ